MPVSNLTESLCSPCLGLPQWAGCSPGSERRKTELAEQRAVASAGDGGQRRGVAMNCLVGQDGKGHRLTRVDGNAQVVATQHPGWREQLADSFDEHRIANPAPGRDDFVEG